MNNHYYKKILNIQLKNFQRKNNDFICNYIKVLEKKTTKKIKNEINNSYVAMSNLITSVTIFSIGTFVFINSSY
jgi:hypothetical protein